VVHLSANPVEDAHHFPPGSDSRSSAFICRSQAWAGRAEEYRLRLCVWRVTAVDRESRPQHYCRCLLPSSAFSGGHTGVRSRQGQLHAPAKALRRANANETVISCTAPVTGNAEIGPPMDGRARADHLLLLTQRSPTARSPSLSS